VEPLTSSKLKGKSKRGRRLMKEQAMLDIRAALMSNPLAEYSPRTKISIMSRMQDANDQNVSMQGSLQDRAHVHQLLKTGIGSMQNMELPNATQSKKKATSFLSLQTNSSSSSSSKGVSIEMPAITHVVEEQEEGQEGGRASLTRNDSMSVSM
jgi:hypothetical protein